jgi:Glycogen recognition site of AMP-activated protein kinase
MIVFSILIIILAKVLYKYLVDGQWKAHPSFAQEYDEHGNLNNYYISPSMPASAAVASATDSVLASHGTTSLVSYVTSGVGAAIATVTGIDPINNQQVNYFIDVKMEPDTTLRYPFRQLLLQKLQHRLLQR